MRQLKVWRASSRRDDLRGRALGLPDLARVDSFIERLRTVPGRPAPEPSSTRFLPKS